MKVIFKELGLIDEYNDKSMTAWKHFYSKLTDVDDQQKSESIENLTKVNKKINSINLYRNSNKLTKFSRKSS